MMPGPQLIIEFKHVDPLAPRPWPVAIDDDNVVTSGLGDDDGAKFIGFARKGETKYFGSTRDILSIDFVNQDIVPVFQTATQMFNWDIPIRGFRHVPATTPTYRVLDLNARKTIAAGLTWGQAHDLIKQGKAASAAARFDIRTEVPE
jgi:hypothetical protein